MWCRTIPWPPTTKNRPDKPAATRRNAGQPLAAEGTRPRVSAQSDTPGLFVVDGTGDVRAGPGDAGATNQPRGLDDPREKAPSSRWVILTMLAVALVTLVAILAL